MHILFLCVEIFLARIIDVSLGTIRTIIVVKGKNLIGSILGFIEVAVWFLVVEQALTTDDFNLFIVISYSLGFATGTYIGGVISKKIINSKYTVQIITDYNVQLLINYIRESSMAVSILKLEGKNKNKYISELQYYGTIDGFPIMVFINDKYQGIYTMNIPIKIKTI